MFLPEIIAKLPGAEQYCTFSEQYCTSFWVNTRTLVLLIYRQLKSLSVYPMDKSLTAFNPASASLVFMLFLSRRKNMLSP